MGSIVLWVLLILIPATNPGSAATSPSIVPVHGFETETECETAKTAVLAEGRLLQRGIYGRAICVKNGTKQIYSAPPTSLNLYGTLTSDPIRIERQKVIID